MNALQSPTHSTPGRYHFGCAEFDPETLELRILGVPVALERRPLRLLQVLLQNADRVVSHEQLLQTVWGGRVTVKNVLPNAMTKLRKALGRDAKLIVTIAGVGYRLNGPVRLEPMLASSAVSTLVAMGMEADLHPERELPANHGIALSGVTRSRANRIVANVPLDRRLVLFRQFAETVARRQAVGQHYTGFGEGDLCLFPDGRLVLLGPRKEERSDPSRRCPDPYRAPEVYRGLPGTERSDIYALGVILYQLTTADFTRPLLADWSQDVDDEQCRMLIEMATRADPRDRPASVSEWLAVLDEPAAFSWQRMFGLPVKMTRKARV